MKSEKEIREFLEWKMIGKDIEKEMNIKIRNGQTTLGIRKALEWVLK